jgi:hypothetical protein
LSVENALPLLERARHASALFSTVIQVLGLLQAYMESSFSAKTARNSGFMQPSQTPLAQDSIYPGIP